MPYDDPIDGKFLIQFDDVGKADFGYFFSNSTKYTYIYNGTDLVDTVITENATLPVGNRGLRELKSQEMTKGIKSGEISVLLALILWMS